MAICSKCGATVGEGAQFCAACGAALAVVPAPAPDLPQTNIPEPPVFAPAGEPVVSVEEPVAEETPAVQPPVGEFSAPAPEQPSFTAIPEPPHAPEPPAFTPPAYEQPLQTTPYQTNRQQAYSTAQPGYTDARPEYSRPKLSPDAEENRYLCVFAYMGFLAVLPAVLKPNSQFVRYHLNQGLAMILLYIMSAVCCIVPLLGWIAGGLGMLFSLICAIIGIVRSCQGQMKPLPLIGNWRILR